MPRLLRLVPRFDKETESQYLNSRSKNLAQHIFPIACLYAFAITAFYFWDLMIDSGAGWGTLIVRGLSSIVIVATALSARHNQTAEKMRVMLIIMLLAAGCGIAVPLAMIKDGYSFGLAGLLIFVTCSSFLISEYKNALSIYVPLTIICYALMLVSGVHGTLLTSNTIFLLLSSAAGVLSAYYFDQLSRYRYQLGEHLKNVALRDPLTKLSNRRAVYEKASSLLADEKILHQPISILMLDIDFFKKINDTYGHDGGDDVLREVAAGITNASRGSDLVARWGGEEFVIILPNTTAKDAESFANRLCLRMRRNAIRTGDSQTVSITISIGITTSQGMTTSGRRSLSTLIGEADKALYFCKHNGRDQANSFSALPHDYQVNNGPMTRPNVRRDDHSAAALAKATDEPLHAAMGVHSMDGSR